MSENENGRGAGVDQVIGEDLVKFLTLFEYFLRETPEGRACRAELNQDWEKAVADLRESKQLRGENFSCGKWLRRVQKELLTVKKGDGLGMTTGRNGISDAAEKKRGPGRPKASETKAGVKKKAPLRFKNT